MGKKVKEYKAGDFIFAKVKGYPAWPARVHKPNGKKYFVYFYGTGETANLPPNQIFDYAENKEKFLSKTVKRKDFNDGVLQIHHDFTNNVPIEDIIGVPLAEPMETSANDTGAEADGSLDDTANATDADATADLTNTTAEAPPVEDSDDGALVIDEGKKAKKPPGKATPKTTPAPKEPKTPKGKAKKEDAEKPSEEDKKEEEIVSRSGRKIRPKRFVDEHTEENATLPSPAGKKRGAPAAAATAAAAEPPKKQYQALTQLELEDIKEPVMNADAEKDHILIACLPSGQYVGIKLFQSKPTFKNDAARLQWFRQAAANAVTLRSQLEKGHITVASVSAQIETDLNLSEEERADLDKEREIEEKKSRVQFLKTEMKLIELDAKIKSCLSLEKADADLCLKLIDELMELEVRPLMLLKHPSCVETVRRMRSYVGNAPSWELSAAAAGQFAQRAALIRRQAEKAYRRFKELSPPPSGLSFWEYFSSRVAQFNAATAKLTADELLEMVHEPIELSQPSAHTMRAAIDAANSASSDKEEAETDKGKEKEKTVSTPKKRGAPAKNKKAAATPTPAKVPKRNSTRNKPQAEVASENNEESNENGQDQDKPTEEAENTAETNENNTEKTKEDQDKTKESEPMEVTKDLTEEAEKTTPMETNKDEAISKEKDAEKEMETEESEKPSENGDVVASKDKDVEKEAKEESKAKKSAGKASKDVDKGNKEPEKATNKSEKATKEANKEGKESKKKTKDAEKALKESAKDEKKVAKESDKAEKEADNVTKESEKATKDSEKATKESDKVTKDTEKAAEESEKTKETEKVSKDKSKKEIEKAAKAAVKATKVAEKATKEAEKATKEAEKASKEAEKASKEAEKATKESDKATKESEKATKESEKATKETEKATNETEKAEGEPRAKRVRESTRKEAPPPKSPMKRKSKS